MRYFFVIITNCGEGVEEALVRKEPLHPKKKTKEGGEPSSSRKQHGCYVRGTSPGRRVFHEWKYHETLA